MLKLCLLEFEAFMLRIMPAQCAKVYILRRDATNWISWTGALLFMWPSVFLSSVVKNALEGSTQSWVCMEFNTFNAL